MIPLGVTSHRIVLCGCLVVVRTFTIAVARVEVARVGVEVYTVCKTPLVPLSPWVSC